MMRRNRALVILSLAVGLSLLAAACGGSDNGNGPSPSSSGSEQQAFQTVKEGVLTVTSCLDYAPFETIKNGDEVGFDVDLTEAIAKRLGLTVDWVKADFGPGMFTAVATGQYDMASAAITATGTLGKKRAQTLAFSDFYFNSLQSFAVNTNKTPDIKSTDDLKSGDVVGVQKSTAGEEWATANLEPNGIQVKSYTSATDAFRDLAAGAVVGVVNDEPSSQAIVKDFPGEAVVQPIDTNEKYAFGLSPNNPELLSAWNTALKEVIADGTYARIFKKFFPTGTVPSEFQPS
jgi:polar amino acid transport system substrate-binding protein